MSAAHRNLTRIPLTVFENLIEQPPSEEEGSSPILDAEHLRSAICLKLKQANFNKSQGNKNATGGSTGVTTVGEFLKLSPSVLLRMLDPLLIYAECESLRSRICECCAPSPVTALHLLKSTQDDNDILVPEEANTANTVSSETNRKRHLSSGMSILDSCLKGGFRIGTISEVVGRAGVGKTQLALQLCVIAARYNQGCVYIDTEKKISLHRLQEIAEERVKTFNNSTKLNGARNRYTPAVPSEGEFSYMGLDNEAGVSVLEERRYNPIIHEGLAYKNSREVLENVTVHSPGSTQELLSVVAGIEEEILLRNQEAEAELTPLLDDGGGDKSKVRKFPVRLVILDSIAAPTRRDFGKESAPQRVSAVFQIAQMLKRVADQLQVAVVVINQVGLQQGGDTCSSHRNPTNNSSGAGDGDGASDNIGSDLVAVSAALGTSWHHCVSTRLLLEHERDPHRLNTILDEAHNLSKSNTYDDTEDDNNTAAWKFKRGHIRTATVVKSNTAGYSSMAYEVTAIGLTELT